MQAGRYEPNGSGYKNPWNCTKAFMVTEIMFEKGAISKETMNEVDAYILSSGDVSTIRRDYEALSLEGEDTRAYIDLLNRKQEFKRAQRIAKNRVMPFAEKSWFFGLLFYSGKSKKERSHLEQRL